MNTKILLIVIGVVTALVSAVCIGIYIWKYVRKQPVENNELTDEQITDSEEITNYSAIELDNIQNQINQNLNSSKVEEVNNEQSQSTTTREQFNTEHVETDEINEQNFDQPNFDGFNKPFTFSQTFEQPFNNGPVLIIINDEQPDDEQQIDNSNRVEVIGERSLNEQINNDERIVEVVDEQPEQVEIEQPTKQHRKRKVRVNHEQNVVNEQTNDEYIVAENNDEQNIIVADESVITDNNSNEQQNISENEMNSTDNDNNESVEEQINSDIIETEQVDEQKITGGDNEFGVIDINYEPVDLDIPQMGQSLEDIQEQNERYERLMGGAKTEPVEQPKIIVVDNDESNSEVEITGAEDLTLEDFV